MHDPKHQHADSSASSGQSAGSDPSVGDDVMKVLADVEGQLNRLRNVQKTQDDAITSLVDRTRAVRRAEEDLAQHRQEFSRRQAEMEELRRQLEQDRQRMNSQENDLRSKLSATEQSQREWDQQKQQTESQLGKRQAELDGRAAELLKTQGELQRERDRVEDLSRQCQRQQDEFAQRNRQLDSERAELMQRVNQAEANVGHLIREIEKTQQDLAERTRLLKEATTELSTHRERMKQLETAAQQATQKVEQAERESMELARLADRERQAVQEQLNAAKSQLKDLAVARDAAAAELESSSSRVTALEKTVESLQEQLDERNNRLTESQNKLSLAGRKLSEFAQVLSEQTPQLERGAAAIAMAEQQQEQIDHLTKQLAESKLSSDPEELQRRDKRIDELTEALRQARGQSVHGAGVAEVEQRNAELTRELDELRLEVQNTQLAADQARRQLKEVLDGQAVQTTQDASLAEHAAKVAALTAEIERLHSQAASDLQAQLESQSRRHQQQLEETHSADEQVMQSLRERITELEDDLKDARSGGAKGGEGEQSEFAKKLKKKAEQVGAVAEHLRRRRRRLQKMRLLLNSRPTAESGTSMGAEMRTEVLHKLELERAQVAETRQMLATSERVMVRRWARPKSVVTLACFVLITMFCAGASWLASDHLFPAQVSASVVLEARNSTHTPLSLQEAEGWRTWHTQILEDTAFHQAVAKRMAERRLDGYADAAKVSKRLIDDLKVDTAQNGMMVLTLGGTDGDELTAFLDVLTSALMMESNRQVGKRTDNAPAVATNERREEGRISYATPNPVPIKDERLAHALPIFGGMLAVMLVLSIVIYVQLARAKRVFDQENAALFLDAKIGPA